MDIVKINFCENSSYYIKNDRVRYDISKDIQTNYGIDISNYLEKSYSDKLLGPIVNPDTLVTFISIGNRYLLYLTKMYNEPVSILISIDQLENGCPKMYTCPISLPIEYFSNTIIFSEMIQNRDNQQWYLLLERVLVYNSRVTNKFGLEHIKSLTSIFNKYIDNPLTPFKLALKKYMTVNELEHEITKVDFPIIGIRFYALRYPIVFYFNTNYYNKDSVEKMVLQDNFDKELETIEEQLYKLYTPKHIDRKIGEKRDIDTKKQFILKCKRSNQYGIYNLFTIVNYEDKLVGPARISSIEVQNKVSDMCRENSACYVVCIYNHLFSKFEVVDSTDNYRVSSNNDIETHIYNCGLLDVPDYYREE